MQELRGPATATEPDPSSTAPGSESASTAPGSESSSTAPGAESEPDRVAILLSDDIAKYEAIAEEITRRGPQNDYRISNLDHNTKIPASTLAQIKEFDPDRIVAIGLSAAKASQQFADTPMVFCQVFNYQGHNLVSPNSKGVKLLPPFSLQLEIWKDLSPNLKTVGLITGPNQEALTAEIAQAAQQHQIKLLTRTVYSDKEALFVYKRLIPQIQGFWLLPDNRVLSPRVLREIVSYGRKHGSQTVVFDPQLLSLGAEISFASKHTDVADRVLKLLGSATETQALSGPPMTSLTTLRAEINSEGSNLRSPTSAKLAQYLDDN